MHDVFISYSSYEFDQADYVRDILERNGIKCWIAPRDIPAASNYTKEIPVAIEACKVFVLILSEKAQESYFVIREVERAVTNGKVIVPFMLEECALKQEFNFLLSVHQRFKAYEDNAQALEKLIEQVKCITQMDEKPESPEDDGNRDAETAERIKEEMTAKKPETASDDARKTRKKTIKKVVAVVLLYVVIAVIALSASRIEEFFEKDEQRYAAERAESASIAYAKQFLYDSEYIRQVSEEAITAARQTLQALDGENVVVEVFAVRRYRDEIYSMVFLENLISYSDAEYIYKSEFNAEYAISIYTDLRTYWNDGKAVLDDVDNLLRVTETLSVDQKLQLLDYFEEYMNLVAGHIALRTNVYLLPIDGKDSLKTVYAYVTDDLGNCVLNENTWSGDYNALMQKIDENYAEIERLSKLFQNESALIEQLESEEVG